MLFIFRIRKWNKSLRDFIFYSGIIRFFIETYFQIMIVTLISLTETRWAKLNMANKGLSIFFTTFIVIFPILDFFFLKSNAYILAIKSFRIRFSSLYEDIDINKEVNLFVSMGFFYKRLIFGILIAFF